MERALMVRGHGQEGAWATARPKRVMRQALGLEEDLDLEEVWGVEEEDKANNVAK